MKCHPIGMSDVSNPTPASAVPDPGDPEPADERQEVVPVPAERRGDAPGPGVSLRLRHARPDV